MEILTTTVVSIILLIVGMGVVAFSIRWLSVDDVTSRLQTYVMDLEGVGRQGAQRLIIRTRELSGSFFSRTLVPSFRNLVKFLGRFSPVSATEQWARMLVTAGHPLGLGAREFLGLRVVFILAGGVAAFFIMRRGLNLLNFLFAMLAFLVVYILPEAWLRGRARVRQNRIRRDLPDALDMLSVCATAGLGFDQSLQRVSEYWQTLLSAEFGRVVAEMEMGFSRQQALRNLAARLNVSELNSFIMLILQSDQLGMSISDTLQAQAEQMRIERRFRAEEEVRKIPIKMLVPMAFLIFPAILAIILGPAVPTLIQFITSFGTLR
jgi:tight adherence protein C